MCDDFVDDHVERVSLKRSMQSAHFIENAAQHPHVRLIVIALPHADFRRKVVRSAERGFGKVVGALQHFGDAEVTQLHLVQFGQEDVLTLQISVQYFLSVDVPQSETQLTKPVENLLLRELLPFGFIFLDLFG